MLLHYWRSCSIQPHASAHHEDWRDRTIEVSGHNCGLFLINLCKELPYIVKQEIGLL
jgi:hypothetical protein